MRLTYFIPLCFALVLLTGCGSQAEDSRQTTATGNNLNEPTVDEFFEYLENPQFEKTESIDGQIPYYARRMFEVRTSNNAADIAQAKDNIRETIPEDEEDQDPTHKAYFSPGIIPAVKKLLHTIESIYGPDSTNLAELSTYLHESGVDILNHDELAVGILCYKKHCFMLSIEGGQPLNYLEQLNSLSKDSVFVPTYMDQRAAADGSITQIQFIFNGILFRFHPMNQEAYFDSQLITAAANLALRSKESPLRYYQLNDDRHVVLGTKEEVIRLQKEFGLKLK